MDIDTILKDGERVTLECKKAQYSVPNSLWETYSGGESKARNQRIQNMLRMIGYGENLGSGFPLILNAWNERQWSRPELIEQPELLQVKLILHFDNEPINEPINDREISVLRIIKGSPYLKREDLAKKANISLATLKRVLYELRKKGFLTRTGSNKRGQWLILKGPKEL